MEVILDTDKFRVTRDVSGKLSILEVQTDHKGKQFTAPVTTIEATRGCVLELVDALERKEKLIDSLYEQVEELKDHVYNNSGREG